MRRGRPGLEPLLTFILLVATASPALSLRWPWEKGPWPRSDERPVVTLAHPTIEERLAEGASPLEEGFSFVAYGDQRALGDGEWQRMVGEIAQLDEVAPLLLVLDTGDIVNDGRYSDQFHMLTDILSPLDHLPYLVVVGNHELHNNRGEVARPNTAAFLAYLDPVFGVERMYYRKDVGPVRFLFLDSNDLVYGDPGEGTDPQAPRPGRRAAAQIRWLIEQLEQPWEGSTVVALHHPFLQSSRVYTEVAAYLWSLDCEGRTLPNLLADGGVDLVLTGHTHSYERFLARRGDGRGFTLVNVSGRPRNSVLWFGADARQARDIAGREVEWLGERGWEGLEGWTFEQEDLMLGDRDNQFALIQVDERGKMEAQIHYLPKDGAPVRRGPSMPLR